MLLVTHDFPPSPTGGEGKVAVILARLLVSEGVDLEVVTPSRAGAQLFDESEPYRVHRVESPAKTFIRRTPSFYRASAPVIRRYQGDLIYYFRPAILRRDLPAVVHFHTTRFGEAIGCFRSHAYFSGILNLLYVPLERHMARSANLVLAPTANLKSEIERFSGIPEGSISVLNNPVPVDFWTTSVAARSGAKAIRLLYVGRLDLRKGVFDLLDAFKRSLSRVEEIYLHIVGSGPMLKKLQSWVAYNGCDEIVTFQEGVPEAEVRRLYQSHDLVVIPSLYEPFGVVVAEALAAGATVISSDVCVDLGQIRFPRGNVGALSKAIVDSVNALRDGSAPMEDSQLVAEALTGLREDVVVQKLIEFLAMASARFERD